MPRKKKTEGGETPAAKGAGKTTPAKKKAPPKKTPPTALTRASKALSKVLGSDDLLVVLDPEKMRRSRPHIPSGSIALDYLIGGTPNRFGVPPCPGWPRGAISQIYGHESSGKTTVALQAAAAVCAYGGCVSFIDWEHAVDLSYAQALGVPIEDSSRFALRQPNTLEQGLVILWTSILAKVDLVILDSTGAGVPKDIFEQALKDQGNLGRVGLLAAKWSSFLPKVAAAAAKTGTHVMGISQVRKKINTSGYGGKTTSEQGGEAWKFYASVRMSFARVSSEEGKVFDGLKNRYIDKKVASKIKAKLDKSKVAATQQHEGEFWIQFGKGVDNVRTILEICEAHGVVRKGGAWYSYERPNGDLIKSQGMPRFRKDIEAAAGAYSELEQFAVQRIREAGREVAEPPPVAEDVEIDMDALLAEEDVDLPEFVVQAKEDGSDSPDGE